MIPHYRLLMRLFFPIAITVNATGQEKNIGDTSVVKAPRDIFSIGLGVQHGFIFAHSAAVQNTKGAHPTGVELNFGWQRNDATVWNLCNCFPKRGLMLAWYDYDSKVLGKSLGASYFLEPVYRLGEKTFFSFRGVAGLAYLTNPFDSVHNPGNQSYSSTIGGYLLFGIGLSFMIKEKWLLNGSINYQHISNGGLRQPNKGINWPTAGISLIYQKNPMPYYTGIRSREKFWKHYSTRWDIGVFGIAKRGTDENGNRHRMPLIGGSLQGGKQVGRINMLTLGAEVYWDQSLGKQLKRDSIEASAVRAGLLFGHEFILGKFLFSQKLGVYVFNQTPYHDAVYHRWGIHYRINRHWGIGFHLKAHRQVADFVDVRITYSWQKVSE